MFGNHTFNFEDTEVTFEFTRYVQQLCSKSIVWLAKLRPSLADSNRLNSTFLSLNRSTDEMEEAKNRIDGSNDAEAIKGLLNNLIEKVQNDISLVNSTINASSVNQTLLTNTTAKIKDNTTTANNTTLLSANSKNETSLLGLLADLFRDDRHERNPIENINKLNLVNRSLKELSASE